MLTEFQKCCKMENEIIDSWKQCLIIKNKLKTLRRKRRTVNSLNGVHFNLSRLLSIVVIFREVLSEDTKNA